jgi:hypothetical protein
MTEVEEKDTFNRDGLVEDLASSNYATNKHPRDNSAQVQVYVHEAQDAGGELTAILNRWGYGIQYVSPHDSDDFCFVVRCLPAVYLDSFSTTKRLLEGPNWTEDHLRDRLERFKEDE